MMNATDLKVNRQITKGDHSHLKVFASFLYRGLLLKGANLINTLRLKIKIFKVMTEL